MDLKFEIHTLGFNKYVIEMNIPNGEEGFIYADTTNNAITITKRQSSQVNHYDKDTYENMIIKKFLKIIQYF
jgi:hypothetical protein